MTFVRRPLLRACSFLRSPYPVTAALVAVLGWQLAGLTWSALPTPPVSAARADAAAAPRPERSEDQGPPPTAAIAQLHLFGRPPPEPAAEPVAAPETKLNLALKGIYAAGRGGGMAVIAAGGGGEQVYAVGDTIAGSARITGIFPDRVMLRRGGQPEVLRMDQGEALLGTPAAAAERERSQRSG